MGVLKTESKYRNLTLTRKTVLTCVLISLNIYINELEIPVLPSLNNYYCVICDSGLSAESFIT